MRSTQRTRTNASYWLADGFNELEDLGPEVSTFMAKPTRETTMDKTPYDLAQIVARAFSSDASESAKNALAELYKLAAENRSDDDQTDNQTDDTSTLLSEKRRGRKEDSLRKDVGVDNERTPVRHDKKRVPAGHQVVKGKRGPFLAAKWLKFDSEGELVEDPLLNKPRHDLAYACHKLKGRLPFEHWQQEGVIPQDAQLLELVYRAVFGFDAGLDVLWIERLSRALHMNAGKTERQRWAELPPLDVQDEAEKILAKLKKGAFLGEGKHAQVTVPEELTAEAIARLIARVGYGSGGRDGKRDAKKVVTEFAAALKR